MIWLIICYTINIQQNKTYQPQIVDFSLFLLKFFDKLSEVGSVSVEIRKSQKLSSFFHQILTGIFDNFTIKKTKSE